MSYWVDTTRHYKIWFSKEPEVFLTPENQLRLIYTREKNANRNFFFVYDSRFLDRQAEKDMQTFCERHKIMPIDLLHDISNHLVDEMDKAIYEIALLELNYATPENLGGNLAAASDLVRTLIPLIERVGIYSDFDCMIDFSKMKPLEEISSPFLISSEIQNNFPILNNEIIIPTVDSAQPEKLHPDFISAIRSLQAELLKRYRDPYWALNYLPFQDLKSCIDLELLMKDAVNQYFVTHLQADVFDLRRFCLHANMYDFYLYFRKLSEDVKRNAVENYFVFSNEKSIDKFIRTHTNTQLSARIFSNFFHDLYLFSVTMLSGPNAYLAAFMTSPEKRTNWSLVIESAKAAGIANSIFSTCFQSGNMLPEDYVSPKHEKWKLGFSNDLSWCPGGEERVKEREQALHRAASLIQHAWRDYVLRKPINHSKTENDSGLPSVSNKPVSP